MPRIKHNASVDKGNKATLQKEFKRVVTAMIAEGDFEGLCKLEDWLGDKLEEHGYFADEDDNADNDGDDDNE